MRATTHLALMGLLAGLALPNAARASDEEPPHAPRADASATSAEATLEAALTALLDEDPVEASRLLRPLLVHPDPGIAGEARGLYTLAQRKLDAQEDDALREGRYTFVAWSTLGGIAAGIEIGLTLELDEPELWAGLIVATTGAAFGSSLYLTRTGRMTIGDATLFGWGMVVGGYDAAMVGALFDASPEFSAGLALLGTALGGAAGLLSNRLLAFGGGEASLVASGALWGTAMGLLLLPVFQPTENATELMLLVATNAGLIAGGLATTLVRFSRTRVLLMDLGVLLGGLTMGGIGVIFFIENADGERIIPSMAIAGMLVGAGLALYFSTDVVDDGGPGGGALLNFDDGEVSLGTPVPMVVPGREGGRPGLLFPLAAGRF